MKGNNLSFASHSESHKSNALKLMKSQDHKKNKINKKAIQIYETKFPSVIYLDSMNNKIKIAYLITNNNSNYQELNFLEVKTPSMNKRIGKIRPSILLKLKQGVTMTSNRFIEKENSEETFCVITERFEIYNYNMKGEFSMSRNGKLSDIVMNYSLVEDFITRGDRNSGAGEDFISEVNQDLKCAVRKF